MSWLKWLPWRFIVRRAAHRYGFLDPVGLMARLQHFSQPSEVGEPIELLRAGMVFHARGLINRGVIQHNLDWVWPYWIVRQFDPRDESFMPRAFSITHVNLTHRNWTAIGYPDCPELPIVDPRGLLTPFLDRWSLDAWLVTEDGRNLVPSRVSDCQQRLTLDPDVCVTTETRNGNLQLVSQAWVTLESGRPVCKLRLTATADNDAWLVLSLRPYNPEGISFVHKVDLSEDRTAWVVDREQRVTFSEAAVRHHVSDYPEGDVYLHLGAAIDQHRGSCKAGLVTAAALFPVKANKSTTMTASIPLEEGDKSSSSAKVREIGEQQQCRLQCPDPLYQSLYDAAVASLILHSPEDVYPGPYTYKRFWFRDAAFIIHALLCVGLTDRAKRALDCFPSRQTALGYFRSQEGEWDANGEVLWILGRYRALTGQDLGDDWRHPIERGARWLVRKRLDDDGEVPHAGLLPAGFSAEHLGPNDYYYWDDFWGIAGLRAAAGLLEDSDGDPFMRDADKFETAVTRSLADCQKRLGRPAVPASPYRRLDAGVIGSMVPGYPLQMWPADDPRLLDSAEFLLDNCFVDQAFFQDMIHSGLNAYLTLHVAQVLLRAGDRRYLDLMDAVAGLASPTGQWPEAIHPRTLGGCMGDGHHVWASAEWVMMLRNCFVREEGETLVLCGGIPERWLAQDDRISFGPAPTAFGVVSVTIFPETTGPRVEWYGDWRGETPSVEVRMPGYESLRAGPGMTSVSLATESDPR